MEVSGLAMKNQPDASLDIHFEHPKPSPSRPGESFGIGKSQFPTAPQTSLNCRLTFECGPVCQFPVPRPTS
jgi:hypothetical protein